LKQAEAILLG